MDIHWGVTRHRESSEYFLFDGIEDALADWLLAMHTYTVGQTAI